MVYPFDYTVHQLSGLPLGTKVSRVYCSSTHLIGHVLDLDVASIWVYVSDMDTTDSTGAHGGLLGLGAGGLQTHLLGDRLPSGLGASADALLTGGRGEVQPTVR